MMGGPFSCGVLVACRTSMDERNSSRFTVDEFKPFNRFARFQLLRTFSRKEVFGARRPFGLSPTQLSELNGIGASGLTILATTLHGRIG